MAKGERRGTLSFCFLKMNNLSSFGDLVLFFCLLSVSFLSKPGKNHYEERKKKLWKRCPKEASFISLSNSERATESSAVDDQDEFAVFGLSSSVALCRQQALAIKRLTTIRLNHISRWSCRSASQEASGRRFCITSVY